jgi:heptosyltransferase III
VREHRKTAEKHEAEYNLSLLRPLECTIPPKPELHLELPVDIRKKAADALRGAGIDEHEKIVMLHPGSGGSAHIWKPENFSRLAVELSERGFLVIITGSKKEEELVKSVGSRAGNRVRCFISTLNLMEFAGFIKLSRLFVANSTGPLHIAAAVGVPVIGFYPPVRVMSPDRWGPLTEKKAIFVPDPAKCPRCKGGKCRGNLCMDQIEIGPVAEAACRLAVV